MRRHAHGARKCAAIAKAIRGRSGTEPAGELLYGRVEQGNFDTYRPLRIDEAPVVETHLVKSSEAPGGFGEAPTAVVAPAVTNAIFAATAKRIRTLPIDTNLLKFQN
jgi:CO/xanthine dehydrogenase Mo-binding subunit